MTKLSDVRPSGGTGGSAIKGTWNVTPTVTPASFTPPTILSPTGAFPQTDFASFTDAGSSVSFTSDFGTNGPSPSAKQASVFLDTELDIMNLSEPFFYKIRLEFDSLIDFQAGAVPFDGFAVGVMESALHSKAAIDAVSPQIFFQSFPFQSPYDNVDSFSLAMFVRDNSDLICSLAESYPGYGSMQMTTATVGALLPSGNILDVYVSRMLDVDQVLLWVCQLNGGTPLVIAGYSTGYNSGNAKLLYPYFSILTGDFVGGNAFANNSLTVDLANAIDIRPDLVDLFDQQTVNDLWPTAPLPFGITTPEITTQVSSLPVGAAVNDLYRATVDPGYTKDSYTVRPFGTYVRDGEAVEVLNITGGSEEVKVLNEFREVGGIVSVEDVRPTPSTSSEMSSIFPGANEVTFVEDVGGFIVTMTDKVSSSFPNSSTPFEYFVATAESDEFQYSTFRLERQILKPASPRQSMVISSVAGSYELQLVSSNSGYHSLSGDSSGGVFPGLPDACFIITEDSPRIFDQPPMFYASGAILNYSSETTPLSVGDVITNVSDVTATVVELPSSGVAKIRFDTFRSNTDTSLLGAVASLENDVSVTYQSGTQSMNIDQVSSTILFTNKPAESTQTSKSVYYDYPYAYSGSLALEGLIPMSATYNTGADPVTYFDPDLSSYYKLSEAYDVEQISRKKYILSPNANTIVSGFLDYSGVFGLSWSEPQDRLQSTQGMYLVLLVLDNSDIYGTQYHQIMVSIYDITSGYLAKVSEPVCMEWDVVAGEITCRFTATDDQQYSYTFSEAAISGGTHAQVSNSSNNVSITGTGSSVYSSLGAFTTQDYCVLERRQDITGISVRLTRGVDYTVSNTGEITFTDPLATGYTVHMSWAISFSGIRYYSPNFGSASDSFGTAITKLRQAKKAVYMSTIGIMDYRYSFGYDSWQLPNPNSIPSYYHKKKVVSDQLGQLTVVEGSFDPNLSVDMDSRVINSIVPVSSDGYYKNRWFKRGAYARWNGANTVPFPAFEPEEVPLVSRSSSFIQYTSGGSRYLTESHLNNITDISTLSSCSFIIEHLPKAKRGDKVTLINFTGVTTHHVRITSVISVDPIPRLFYSGGDAGSSSVYMPGWCTVELTLVEINPYTEVQKWVMRILT